MAVAVAVDQSLKMSEVSGLHCTIFSLGPGEFELKDDSRNGTYWNDSRLLKASDWEDWDVQIR